MICFDYRGYADSTDLAPNETGVVNDAKVMLVVRGTKFFNLFIRKEYFAFFGDPE